MKPVADPLHTPSRWDLLQALTGLGALTGYGGDQPAAAPPAPSPAWGHPSNRVAIGRFNLSTRTGRFRRLPADGSLEDPYWLPNLQRPTRQGAVVGAPDAVIRTRGNPGGDCCAGGRDAYVHRLS